MKSSRRHATDSSALRCSARKDAPLLFFALCSSAALSSSGSARKRISRALRARRSARRREHTIYRPLTRKFGRLEKERRIRLLYPIRISRRLPASPRELLNLRCLHSGCCVRRGVRENLKIFPRIDLLNRLPPVDCDAGELIVGRKSFDPFLE